MPQGDKSKYTDKQKRQAEHIEEGYEKRGVGKKTAESRAWATVNSTSGGGKKAGSGRAKKAASSRKSPPRSTPKRASTAKRATTKKPRAAAKRAT